SDDSYDFSAIRPFLEKFRQGYDLVLGNRFQGGMRTGAMPWKHRWIGNPALTSIGRLLFRCPVGDFHCGLRGFRKESYKRLNLQTTGMEFASEMVIKSTLLGQEVTEVPTVLHKDGRSRPPHLRSWRDGWRHLRLMLLYSPVWLFLIPGLVLTTLALLASVRLWMGPLQLGGVVFDIHSLLVVSFLSLLGYQLLVFAAFAKSFAIMEGLHPPLPRWLNLRRYLSLEVGVLAGLGLLVAGFLILGDAFWSWHSAG